MLDLKEVFVNKAKLVIGIMFLGIAIAAYSLGYSTYIGEVGNGMVTIYPAAALALLGGLTLWRELKKV